MEWSSSFGWADIIQIVILAFAVYAAFSANKNVSKSVNFTANRQMIDSFFDKLCLMCKSQFLPKEERKKIQTEFYGLSYRMIACVKNKEAQKKIKEFFSLINRKDDLFKNAAEEDFQQICASEEYKAIDNAIEMKLFGLSALLEKELLGKKEIAKKIAYKIGYIIKCFIGFIKRLSEDERLLIDVYRSLNEEQKRETAQFLSNLCGIPDKTYTRPDVLGTFSHQKQDLSNDNQA